MCAHLYEEFTRDSSDLRQKDLTMTIATVAIGDDDNDKNHDACMVGRFVYNAIAQVMRLQFSSFSLELNAGRKRSRQFPMSQ